VVEDLVQEIVYLLRRKSGLEGRKVLVTPGLVEADESLNEKVARRADGRGGGHGAISPRTS